MASVAQLSINVIAHGVSQANTQLQGLAGTASRVETHFRRLYMVLGGFAIARVLQSYVAMADQLKRLEGQLRLVTDSSAELHRVQEDLFDLAQRTRTSLPATIDLYARLARSTEAIGISGQQLLQVTEAVNQAIQVGGSTSQEATAGVIQFGQALASGTLRGDELRSVLENMPRLAKALKEGLEEQGLAGAAESASGALRRLAKEGLLDTESMIEALLSQTDELAEDFAEIPRTVGQAWTQFENQMFKVVEGIEGQGGLTPSLIRLIDKFTELAQDPGVIRFLGDLVGLARDLADAFGDIANAMDGITTLRDAQQNMLAMKALERFGIKPTQEWQNEATRVLWNMEDRVTLAARDPLRESREIGGIMPSKPIVGGGGTSSGSKVDQYERLVTQLERAIDLTNTLAIQEGLRDEAAKKQIEIELRWGQELARLKDEGRQVAEAEGGFILTLIEQQVNAEANLATQREANRIMTRLATDDRARAEQAYQDQLRQTQQIGTEVAGTLQSMLHDAVAGTLTWRDALADVLDMVLRIAEQAAFGSGGAGGFLGNILGSLIGGGNAFAPIPGMSAKALGGVYDSTGELHAFRNGGIVGSPTLFRYAQGGSFRNGIMGEAGPEAIMPLRHGPGGRLGVDASGMGGSGVTLQTGDIVVNVEKGKDGETPEDFGKRAGAAVRRELKGLVIDTMNEQMMPGGRLYRGR